MAEHTDADVEEMITNALGNETFLRAPLSLHRRVEERLRFAALYDKERNRFRYSMATVAVAFVGMIAATVFIVAFINFSLLVNNGFSGGQGQYDSLAASTMLLFTGYSGAYTLLSSIVLALGTLFVVLLPLRKATMRKIPWTN